MINRYHLVKFAFGVALVSSASGGLAAVNEYASSVIGFSSQYTTVTWSADQALGTPDTLTYGDIPTAWAPSSQNGSLEYITLGFTTPVYAVGATVRETWGNGFVYQIDALDQSNVLHTVWTGTDYSLPGAPVDANFSWAQTPYLINGLKIYTNTDHNMSTWEEIDAVRLNGTAPIPEPEIYAMMAAGLGLMGFVTRRRQRKLAAA